MNIQATTSHVQTPVHLVQTPKAQQSYVNPATQNHSTPIMNASAQSHVSTVAHAAQSTYNKQGESVQHASAGQKLDIRG